MREPTKQAKLEAIEALSGGAQPIFNTSCGTCVDCGPYRWRRRGEIVQPKDCEFSGRYDHNTMNKGPFGVIGAKGMYENPPA